MAGAQDPEALRREVLEQLAAHSDESYRISDLVSTRGAVLNVRVPEIRRLVKEFAVRHRDLRLDDVRRLMDLFCRHQGRDEILFGTFLLAQFRRDFPRELWKDVDRWVEALDNWETCDQLAMNVGGELVARDLSLVEGLEAWARSPNPWRRRFAAAATTVLNQKGRSHPEATFRVCAPLMADPEVTVQKAVAWAIREVAKVDEETAFEFLKRSKEKAHPRTLREASQKLSDKHKAQLLP